MADNILKVVHILNHKTSAEWATTPSFVPEEGELCLYDDLGKGKLGDGTTTIANLEFLWSTPDEAADAGDVLFTNLTPTVQKLGGVEVGTTFNNMPVTDVLNKLLYPWVAPTISGWSLTPANGLRENGNTATVTAAKFNVTKKSANITKVELLYGGSVLATKSGADLGNINSTTSAVTYTFSGLNKAINQTTATKYFQARVTDADRKTTTSNSGSYSFASKYYHGCINAGVTLTADIVKSWDVGQACWGKTANGSGGGSGSLKSNLCAKENRFVTHSPVSQHIVYVSPYKVKQIKDQNNFDVTSTYTETRLNITNTYGYTTNYYVYTSNATSTATDFGDSFFH